MSAAEAQEAKYLLQGNDQYRQLASMHHELDTRVHELTEKHYLSTDEELEEHRLKKRKLALKDQMEAIVRQFHAHAS